jgi:hypothetical protein
MTPGFPSCRVVVTVLACAGTALTSIGALGQTPSAPACRTYSAEEVRTLSGAGSGTINQTCRFDSATFERTCTIRSRTNAGSFTLDLTDKYASVADFVDEIRVIPPIARIQRQMRRFVSGPAANADVTYEYDGARRQTRISTAMKGNLIVMTYNGWDAMGRPTGGVSSSRASTVTLKYDYDDAARTMTITGPAGVEVDTYNADGNMIQETSTDGGGKTEYAIKITKTETVCR